MPSGRASLLRASPTGPGPRRGCGRHEASQVPHKGRLHVPGVSDCARSIPHSPTNAWDDVAFSSAERDRHLGIRPVSQLNTQPMVSPVNASRTPSRVAAHHSGPERLARPYSVVDFHLLSFASLSWRSRFLAINDRIGHVRLTATMPPAIAVHRKQVRNRPSMSYVPPGAGVISGGDDLPVMTQSGHPA